MKIGIMTGGGDAPGLNGIIEAVSTILLKAGHEVVGILDGFDGMLDGRARAITLADVNGLHSLAGTFLGTTNKSKTLGREAEFQARFRALGLDGLIVAGGDGTFAALSEVGGGKVPVIGVPKTIDNDLQGTEVTFGFDTACSVVAEAVDALRVTADAHRRVMIVETMGRTAGWIALGGGLSSYADAILIPERPFERAALLTHLKAIRASGRRGCVLVASESAMAKGENAQVAFRVEGSVQAERYGGVAEKLARWIEKEIDWEGRHVVLGHLQRARSPTTTDRFLTLSMGAMAAQLAMANDWGKAIVFRDGRVSGAQLEEVMGPARTVPHDHRWVKLAQSVGIFI